MANSETAQVRDALVMFLEKLDPQNTHGRENWGWNTSSDPCNGSWRGVTCYTNSQTVRKIVLEELNLTGTLDASSLCVTKALTVLSLSSNSVVGAFPEEISRCSRLTHVYLHRNRFSGNLPTSLSKLSNLKRIDVSDNEFSGEIPNVARISGLLSFLAEDNKLSGGIPEFDFSNLEEFNVSNNNLNGSIPNVGGKFNESSFLGNPGLCGMPLSNACTLLPPARKTGSFRKDHFLYAACAGIGLIIVSLIAFIVIKTRRYNEKKGTVNKGVREDNTHEKLSSTSSESKAAGGKTSEFSVTSHETGKGSSSLVVLSNPTANGLKFEDLLRSPAELIGRGRRGTLYKVIIEDGSTLAVKRIKDWDITRADFMKRMQRIDDVKHPNVMPLVAFYCSRQEKLLVYEFQQNGSLFKLLHGSQNDQLFDWGSRMSIAAKISEAMAFMHESLQACGIAHGNLKSSNILLSDKMEPFISEYGLREVETQDHLDHSEIESFQKNNSITRKNAFKADIYSFGIILLELLTGKLVQNNGCDLARWVNSAMREEWTVEVFDEALISEGVSEEKMMNLLQVALTCMDSLAEARPNMRDIARMINSVQEYEEKSIFSDP
ncbi:Leucine-rich repeat protein kinase family protein [Dorcoceras hygrometricum]|uniref:Leucine-rich repeat protein kinase family protein n=1 Tax=Dorcoceras hygrometricum TaxID=472368 RepID=A0A2Z7C623_9LAMI|nr:Leucine-rich repeat protein kinase family protein [Dorcoceras hygrometricum]